MRYIKNYFFIIYTLIKFLIIKIFHINTFSFSFIEKFSPYTTISFKNHSKIKFGKLIKANSGTKISCLNGGFITIGDNVFLGYRCIMVCWDKINISNNVQFGPNVLIYDHDHDFRTKDGMKNLKYKTSPVEIGENTWIGANTVILRGTKIGKNCVVGAGSIIKGEYPDNSIILQKRETSITHYEFEK